MKQSELISYIENKFPVCLGEVQMHEGSVCWSVYVDDREELADMAGQLYMLEDFFADQGYTLEIQDDPDCFGGMLTPR